MEGFGENFVVDHHFRLMEGLWIQKLQGKFCDVVIKVLEHCVSIHSCVLAAFSSDNLFTDNLVNVIEVDICDDLSEEDRQNKELYVDALDKIVNFIYRGELHFEEKNVRLIKKIADSLQLEQVKNQCMNFMTEKKKILQTQEKLQRNKARKTITRKIRRSTPLLNPHSSHNIRINPSEKYITTKNNNNNKYLSNNKRPHASKSSLIRNRTRQDVRKRYTCNTCGFFALKVKPLLCHLKENRHDGTLCSLCNFQATSNDELLQHLEQHDDEKPFFCFSCNARFQTRTALNLHLPKHSDEKPYICTECGKGFKWKHALQNHLILHTNSKQHLCDQCGYRTAHQSSFKAHCLLHSGNTFKCVHPGCNFQAARKQNLNQHEKTHSKEKPFQCEVCGHAFSLVKNLRRHARIHNANENLIRCTNCEFSTTRVDKLKEHNKKHHSKHKNVQMSDYTSSVVNDTLMDNTPTLNTLNSTRDNLNSESSVIISDSAGQLINFPTLQLFPVYTLVASESNVIDNH